MVVAVATRIGASLAGVTRSVTKHQSSIATRQAAIKPGRAFPAILGGQHEGAMNKFLFSSMQDGAIYRDSLVTEVGLTKNHPRLVELVRPGVKSTRERSEGNNRHSLPMHEDPAQIWLYGSEFLGSRAMLEDVEGVNVMKDWTGGDKKKTWEMIARSERVGKMIATRQNNMSYDAQLASGKEEQEQRELREGETRTAASASADARLKAHHGTRRSRQEKEDDQRELERTEEGFNRLAVEAMKSADGLAALRKEVIETHEQHVVMSVCTHVHNHFAKSLKSMTQHRRIHRPVRSLQLVLLGCRGA